MSDKVNNSQPPRQLALSVGLRDDATLENFFSHHNDLAVQAIEGVAEGVGESFVGVNPGRGVLICCRRAATKLGAISVARFICR